MIAQAVFLMVQRGIRAAFAVYGGKTALDVVVPQAYKVIKHHADAAAHVVFFKQLFKLLPFPAAPWRVIGAPDNRNDNIPVNRNNSQGKKGAYRSGCMRRFGGPNKGFAKQRQGRQNVPEQRRGNGA
jgi:hypothetical protein